MYNMNSGFMETGQQRDHGQDIFRPAESIQWNHNSIVLLLDRSRRLLVDTPE